jgi:LEA14-like dessication related protein
MRPALAALVAGALLGSCALVPQLTMPELSVVGLQLEGGDFFTQRLKVRVHVRNPNDRALPIKGIEYTLEVDGQPFAAGESAASFVVPALGEADFDMNVTANVTSAVLRLLTHAPDAAGARIPYRLSGKVALSEGWLQSIPFEQHGTFKP